MEAKILPTGASNVPITVLGIWKTSVEKTDKMPCLQWKFPFSGKNRQNSASKQNSFVELTF